ncbi:hypothetical protein CGLO_03189 [Colletotrichum gloeosporioides Cg-14]|uniref:Uncharacterized protein n=1 Tax=Colletotrichum gloeosporioides (strain Cg-14) TaxID=1237896 RepID=T0LYW2_COLGC|nr:hypothetical protein CGLO_03189 [Colletotrichum gloeosporioides Cg-14]
MGHDATRVATLAGLAD